VSKVRERLAVTKHAAQKFDIEKFSFRKLDRVRGKEQYQVKISNRFASLENLNGDLDVNRDCETIAENIKISIKEILG
jgi:hypothetical protein